MSTDELEHKDSDEILNAAVAGILSIVSILFTSVHCYKVYQDLFTSERASVRSKRDEKPTINAEYKKATYLTLITAILYCTLMVVFAIEYNFSYYCMPGFVFIEFIAFYGTKCGLYLTYILRLHLVYGATPYGYKVGKMICLAGTVITFSCVLLVIGEVVLLLVPQYHDDSDNVFPHYCSISYPMDVPYAAALAYLTLLYDVVATITAIIGFTVPLNKIIKLAKSISAADGDGKVDDEYNFKHYGYKYKVIVFSASISTLLWIVLFMVGLGSVATVFYLLDVIVNPICLLLMTPYYPSKAYYERLCCMCILCCDRQKKSHVEESELKTAQSQVTADVTAISSDTKTSTKETGTVTTKADIGV